MSQKGLPYYILLDSQTSQVEQQDATGTRLNTLYGALTSVFGVAGSGGAQSPLQFTPLPTSGGGYGPITAAALQDVKVLAVLTRWQFDVLPTGSAPFSTGELNAIQQFVSGGGGLLLMSDHGAFPGKNANFTVNDVALAGLFGFQLNPMAIAYPQPETLIVMSGSQFTTTGAPQIFSGVTSVVAHDGCGIQITGANGATCTPLVAYPSGVVNTQNSQEPTGQYFAATAEYSGGGRVVVIANSGLIADIGNTYPAPGLGAYGSNLFFILNACSWLAHLPPWDAWGQGFQSGG